jgi:hypothetical protein
LRSLRRAVELADGWNPFAVTGPQVRDWLGRVELPDSFEVVLSTVGELDPLGAPEHTREVLADTAGFGATIAYPRFEHHSLGHYLESLEALAALHDPNGGVTS